MQGEKHNSLACTAWTQESDVVRSCGHCIIFDLWALGSVVLHLCDSSIIFDMWPCEISWCICVIHSSSVQQRAAENSCLLAATCCLATLLAPSFAVWFLTLLSVLQLCDVDIDMINKPYLPIPSGQLSVKRANELVWGSLILGHVLPMLFYPFDKGPLMATIIGSSLLGTIYSLPPFRLKRFPLLAAL